MRLENLKNLKSILMRILKIAVSAALITFTLRRIGIEQISAQLADVEWIWLAGGLLIFTFSYLLGTLQWMHLLHARSIDLSWKQTLSYYYVGLFFNNFLISNLGGDIFRMVDIRKVSGDGSGAVSTVVLDRFLGLFVLSGLAVITAPYWLTRGMPVYLLWLLGILAIVWLILLICVFSTRAAANISKLMNILPGKLRNRISSIYNNIRGLAVNRKLMFRLLLISLFVQGLRIMMHYCVARGLGVTLSPVYFLVIIPIIAIAASLPISLGGLGVREQTGIILFGSLGVPVIKAFSIEFIAYLIAVASSIPGGLHFALRRSVNQTQTACDRDEIKFETPVAGGEE